MEGVRELEFLFPLAISPLHFSSLPFKNSSEETGGTAQKNTLPVSGKVFAACEVRKRPTTCICHV
jgi:hypothetical protein